MTNKIKHPRKRIVVLELKKEKETYVYSTCAELAVSNDKSKIGVSLGALWNALAKNNGVYENDLCKIHYRKIENNNNTEWK